MLPPAVIDKPDRGILDRGAVEFDQRHGIIGRGDRVGVRDGTRLGVAVDRHRVGDLRQRVLSRR